ncbi:MAG: hypothetical protein KGI06_06340, partial [Candidatus Micrarchaeota archaeon]|nr:hypothetical protein [Candidatus Micrarchaeota archaeon]
EGQAMMARARGRGGRMTDVGQAMTDTDTAAEGRHPFGALAEMAMRLGARDIGGSPGCWEHTWEQGGGEWYVAVNGHGVDTHCSRGRLVPPVTAYVEYNGWPAGLIDPGGWMLAEGKVANLRTFMAACDAAGPGVRKEDA